MGSEMSSAGASAHESVEFEIRVFCVFFKCADHFSGDLRVFDHE